MAHKKIMLNASKKLRTDAKKYSKEAETAAKKGNKKEAKHELVERREALSAAKDLKRRAKMAHE